MDLAPAQPPRRVRAVLVHERQSYFHGSRYRSFTERPAPRLAIAHAEQTRGRPLGQFQAGKRSAVLVGGHWTVSTDQDPKVPPTRCLAVWPDQRGE